jgi:DNA mismatch repair protein PMS2
LCRCYKAATLDIYVPSGDEAKSNSLAAATNELDRLFSKEDFGEMEVLGIILYFKITAPFC